MKILFVCLGNICRSALAEGIMNKLVQEEGLEWVIDSAGTGGWHVGEAPDPRAIRIAKENGIDIARYQARQLQKKDAQIFDRILVMDQANYEQVLKMTGVSEHAAQIDFLLNSTHPSENKAVPDPWYDDKLFAPVFNMIDTACRSWLMNLKNELP